MPFTPTVLTFAICLRGGKLPSPTENSERVPGHTVLYRGIDLLDTQEIIDETAGEYSLHRFSRDSPTDFHEWVGYIAYFALEKDMAEKFAKWTKHIVNHNTKCVSQTP